ncbi:abortive infection family protein [Myxococcus sp. Y35]|uniref:abortive infection family protein n=1 Tax=Pseudomyxococcus flavus TaxID=3115648 RepID=UPI003CEAEE38
MPLDLHEQLKALETCVAEVEQHDNEIRQKVLELSERLADFCARAGISFSTEDFDLEEFGTDEKVFGYLGASESGLTLHFRSTLDIFGDDFDPYEEPKYTVATPETWDANWLRRAATEERLKEVVGGLVAQAQSLLEGRSRTAESVRHAAAGPAATAASELAVVARDLSFPRVIEHWARAQRKVSTEPASAATAACTLVETVLKHIIERLELQAPAEMTVTKLYHVVAGALDIRVDRNNELHNIARALNGAISNLGAFRSEAGDAHGRSPDQKDPSVEEAEFVVNTAGAVAMFLMRRLSRTAQTASSAAGSPATKTDNPPGTDGQ